MGQCSSEKFIVSVPCLQIGIRNDVLNNLLDLVDSDVEKLSTGEEVSHNTLVTLNQVIAKIRQNRETWDVNDGLMLRHKSMQINLLWVME